MMDFKKMLNSLAFAFKYHANARGKELKVAKELPEFLKKMKKELPKELYEELKDTLAKIYLAGYYDGYVN